MLSSIRSRRRFILASVKFLSRALTALNFDPSMATLAALSRSSLRHSATNSRQTSRMALPLSFRKSAMILKSGGSSRFALALPFQASARRHAIEVAVDVELKHHAGMRSRQIEIKVLLLYQYEPRRMDVEGVLLPALDPRRNDVVIAKIEQRNEGEIVDHHLLGLGQELHAFLRLAPRRGSFVHQP